jgi:hypothetical protein
MLILTKQLDQLCYEASDNPTSSTNLNCLDDQNFRLNCKKWKDCEGDDKVTCEDIVLRDCDAARGRTPRRPTFLRFCTASSGQHFLPKGFMVIAMDPAFLFLFLIFLAHKMQSCVRTVFGVNMPYATMLFDFHLIYSYRADFAFSAFTKNYQEKLL